VRVVLERSAGTLENVRLMIEGARMLNREVNVTDLGLLHLFLTVCSLYSRVLLWKTVVTVLSAFGHLH
jgi:hypothetical protein